MPEQWGRRLEEPLGALLEGPGGPLGASLVLRARPAVRRGSCSSVVVPGAAVFHPLWSFLSSWPGRFLSCKE